MQWLEVFDEIHTSIRDLGDFYPDRIAQENISLSEKILMEINRFRTMDLFP